MKILVTGASGFVGRFLVRELVAAGHAPVGFDRCAAPGLPAPMIEGDILDPAAVAAAVRDCRPDAGVHLAALAFPPDASSRPALMAAVNVQGAVHVYEAFRREAPAARLLAVSSARVYGSRPTPAPRREEDPLEPDSLYAVTKAAADGLALQYARELGCPFLVARPHNHTGPGQPPAYAVAAFAAQFRAIARGDAPPCLRVGNTASTRDFLDVRDVARAYRLLLEKGRPGLAYNIASGRPVTIASLLDRFARLAGVRPRLETDPALVRPADASAPLDTGRIRQDTGWEPRIPLDETLRDMLADPAGNAS